MRLPVPIIAYQFRGKQLEYAKFLTFFDSTIPHKRNIWYNTGMPELEAVLEALRSIRAPRTVTEYDLHALVAEALASHGLLYRHEAKLAPRRRIDILCGCVGVEIKRGRPSPAPLLRQLTGYAQSEEIQALVLVADHPPRLPGQVAGKPLAAVSLQRLWGIAL